MSEPGSQSPQVIDDAAFTRLVAKGLARVDNVVTGDEAIEALGDVDPTPDAIEKLRERLADNGVTLDDYTLSTATQFMLKLAYLK